MHRFVASLILRWSVLPYRYDQRTKLSKNVLANADRIGSPLPGKKTEVADIGLAKRQNRREADAHLFR
jgi:hypothetical protein